MGSVYQRKGTAFFWLAYVDGRGERCLVSSKTDNLEEAKKVLAILERRAEAERELGLAKGGPLTVRRYAERWLEGRRQLGLASVGDDAARLEHVLPALGAMELKAVRRRHVQAAIRAVEAKGLAPRTVHHVHGVLRTMFGQAVFDELLDANPAGLSQRRGEITKKRDADPAWRATAIFTRNEAELLFSDERIPLQRRVRWALLFLTGMRINEVSARTWRDYDARAVPLGKLTVGSSYSRKRKAVKPGTKAGPAREVPVHPTLARLLAQWRLSGWAEAHGRQPKPEDLLVPREDGRILDCVASLVDFHQDAEALGLRPRRQHDARRTFISLALADGARRDVLQLITHGPPGDIMGLYTTPSWETLCQELGKLGLRLLEGRVLALTRTATVMLQPKEGAGMTGESPCTGRDLNAYASQSDAAASAPTHGNSTEGAATEGASAREDASDCSAVADPSGYEELARRLGLVEVFRSGT